MKIKRSLSMVLAAALALCCVSLNAFAADRDEIQTLDLSDVKIVESTDWAEPVALPRSGLGGAFIELSDAKIVDSADWATLLTMLVFCSLFLMGTVGLPLRSQSLASFL